MAKLKNPLLSFDARGRIGKLITLTRRQKAVIAEKTPVIPDAKTLAQLSWRHMFQKVVALWHALSASEKQEWESSARPHHMTGYAYFLSQALKPNPGLYLPLQGGTMAGDINMDSNRILNLPSPVDPLEPARLVDLVGVNNFLALTDTPADYAGEALKVARVNAAEDALEFAIVTGGYTEGARVYHSEHQTIPHSTTVYVAFNQESYDTDNIHDSITNNSRLTCKTAGKYLIFAQYYFASSAVGSRSGAFQINRTTTITADKLTSPGAGYYRQHIVQVYPLAVNDFVELFVDQSSGGNLNLNCGLRYQTHFGIQRIG